MKGVSPNEPHFSNSVERLTWRKKHLASGREVDAQRTFDTEVEYRYAYPMTDTLSNARWLSAFLIAILASVPETRAAGLKDDFTYLGKPVSPWCLYNPETQPEQTMDGIIDLSACRPSTAITIEVGKLVQDEPDELVEPPERMTRGTYQYGIIKKVPDGFLLDYLWSGGGTGQFMGIDKAVVLDDHRLELLPVLPQGDRCVGSIADIHLSLNQVIVTREVPLGAGIMLLTGGDPMGIDAYPSLRNPKTGKSVTLTADDFYNGPQSCDAIIRYAIDPEGNVAVPLGILFTNTFIEPGPEAQKNSAGQTYAECLGDAISEAGYDEKELPASHFASFMQEASTACVK